MTERGFILFLLLSSIDLCWVSLCVTSVAKATPLDLPKVCRVLLLLLVYRVYIIKVKAFGFERSIQLVAAFKFVSCSVKCKTAAPCGIIWHPISASHQFSRLSPLVAGRIEVVPVMRVHLATREQKDKHAEGDQDEEHHQCGYVAGLLCRLQCRVAAHKVRQLIDNVDQFQTAGGDELSTRLHHRLGLILVVVLDGLCGAARA